MSNNDKAKEAAERVVDLDPPPDNLADKVKEIVDLDRRTEEDE